MKFYSLFAAAMLCSTIAFGQRLGGNHNEEAGAVNTGAGIKGGLNIASMYNATDGLDTEGITSYHFGIYGKLGFGEKFGLQLEALYSRRGANFEYNAPIVGNQQSEFRFDYIDVPLLLTYNILSEERLTVMAGPQASLMITAKYGEGDNEKDLDPFHTYDMGAAVGLQTGYKMVRAGVRYNIGFRDIINTEDARNESGFGLSEGNFQNHFGQVYVALEF